MGKMVLRGALYAGGADALGVLEARPSMDRWGSIGAERALPLACDELVTQCGAADAAVRAEGAGVVSPRQALRVVSGSRAGAGSRGCDCEP